MDQGAASYRRFLAGDETGLTELVAQFADGLILFVLPIAGDAAAAEDIAEETFARLCIRKPAYKDTASFKTWLYTIARNLALDRARKRARVTFADDETLAAVPDAADTPEEAYIRRETQQTLKNIKESNGVLTLTYIEGLSNRQTAKVMRKSVHAVENLNSRARAALKKALEAEGVTG